MKSKNVVKQTVAPVVTAMEELMYEFQANHRRFGDLRKEFVERFEKDPLDAFAWAEDYVAAAARVNVWQVVEAMIQKGVTLEDIARTLRDEAWRAAKWPTKSTSPARNLADQCKGSACAEVVERLDQIIAVAKRQKESS